MRLVITTCKPEEAEMIADTLLGEGLIASCNIISGITTKVRWKGENITQPESMLIMRTRAELVWKLESRMVELNSFEVPEVASIEVKEWNPAYFNWIYKATELPVTRSTRAETVKSVWHQNPASRGFRLPASRV